MKKDLPAGKAGFAPILIIILIALVAFGAYFLGKGKLPILNPTPTPISTTTPTISPTPSPTPNWQTYKNSNWNFELTLPNSWEGYLTSEHNWTSTPNSQYTANVCFYFNRPSSIPACILQISIFTQEQWNSLNIKPKLFKQKDNYYFSTNDYDPQCTQLDQFQCDRSKEIPEVLSTFKFTN